MIAAYPLQWPEGWKRTPPHGRRVAKFGRGESVRHDRGDGTSYYTDRKRELTVADGVGRVLAELARMGVRRDDVVVSTNVRTRLDGLPRSDQRKPEDPGAAVYWTDPFDHGRRAPRVMAIDRYTDVADNLAAIAATLEAMRAIERHGGAAILERAFTGFTALPAPGQTTARSWREVLGVGEATVTAAGVEAAYKRGAMRVHPDRPGGSHEAMAELNRARDQALAAIRGSA